jgi:hypothetical protein
MPEFDNWVCRSVLSPLSPLFRESRYLLAAESDIRDTALYHSVLTAVAEGTGTRGGIASYIGRKAVEISHPLTVLEDSQLLVRETDLFRAGKSRYRIAEPLINFYEAVMRPAWQRLEAGQAAEVWAGARERCAAQVAGPAFEAICREYMLRSGRTLLDGHLGTVGSGIVTDPVRRQQIEVDVAAVSSGSGSGSASVSMLGEARWGTVIGGPSAGTAGACSRVADRTRPGHDPVQTGLFQCRRIQRRAARASGPRRGHPGRTGRSLPPKAAGSFAAAAAAWPSSVSRS